MLSNPAPAYKVPHNMILEQSKLIKQSSSLANFAQFSPDLLLVLNEQRQVVYSNSEKENEILGLRPGDLFDCKNSKNISGGCGTSEFCKNCGALTAILNSQDGMKDSQECRISTTQGESIDLRITSFPIDIDDNKYVLLGIADIGAEKRVRALERIFFHDVLNTAGGIKSITNLMENSKPDEMEELVGYLRELSEQLIDEIQSQRQLAQAENNELRVEITSFFTDDLLNTILKQYSKSEILKGKSLKIDPTALFAVVKTDFTLLRRVVGNLVKNAIEASNIGDSIFIGNSEDDKHIKFWVHNSGVMSKEVQLQVFSRSFSTKGLNRGLGTYSIKLLTEKYLNGKVSFESNDQNGTTFIVEIPKNI